MKNASSYCVPLRNWFSLVALLCLGVACGSETDDDGGTPDGSCQPGDNKDGDAFVCAPYGDDCDDTDPSINPDAVEIPYDGIDQDCDTVDEVDLDQDGHDAEQVGGDDCDDRNNLVYEGAQEGPPDPERPGVLGCDGLDNDCDGKVDNGTACVDDDLDGHKEDSHPPDCDDTREDIHPGAAEGLDTNGDGVLEGDDEDNDCDGVVDNGTDLHDDDGDGLSEEQGDCDDANPLVAPGQREIEYNHIDDDCEDGDLQDVDEDGFLASEVDGPDCNDKDFLIKPLARETPYDGIDQDCDGSDLTDQDHDGFSSTEVVGGTDCEDLNQAVNPGQTEVPYNGADDDCVEGDEVDVDRDGFVASEVDGNDCNDSDPDIRPYRIDWFEGEGIDNNCDVVFDSGPQVVDNSPLLIKGQHTFSQLGMWSGLGNLDGDDYPDLVVGLAGDITSGVPGGVAIWLGVDWPELVDQVPFAELPAPGLLLTGDASERVGYNGLLLDLNGDGMDDLVLGAPGYDHSRGAVYLVSGRADWPAVPPGQGADLFSVADTRLIGERRAPEGSSAGDRFGLSLAAGDFTGDGALELAVGAPGVKDADDHSRGAAYVVASSQLNQMFGARESGGGREVAVAGLVEQGESGASRRLGVVPRSQASLFGESMAAVDINADGKDDLAVVAPWFADATKPAGAIFMWYGGDAFSFAEPQSGDQVVADVVVGWGKNNTGREYLLGLKTVYDELAHREVLLALRELPAGEGSSTKPTELCLLVQGVALPPDLDSAPHVVLTSRAERLALGSLDTDNLEQATLPVRILADVGDVDGDGLTDLAVGSVQADLGVGYVYVFRGGPDLWTDGADDHHQMATLRGMETSTRAGEGLLIADFDGDGIEEVGVGAPGSYQSKLENSGAYHLFWGGP